MLTSKLVSTRSVLLCSLRDLVEHLDEEKSPVIPQRFDNDVNFERSDKFEILVVRVGIRDEGDD